MMLGRTAAFERPGPPDRLGATSCIAMAGRRKRKRPAHGTNGGRKRQRVEEPTDGNEPVVKQALLAQYYPKVLSLREYLLSRLPESSKFRRKKILSVGRKPEGKETDRELSRFLDKTLVGLSNCKEASDDERWRQWTLFSQSADDSKFADLSGVGQFSQSEIVDFAVWSLFSKSRASNGTIAHLLCQGFRKDVTARPMERGGNASAIPGIVSYYPNRHVTSMKTWPWPQVLALMGKEGERTMIDLILDCGIFLLLEVGHGSFQQLSGLPLGDLQLLSEKNATETIIPLKRSAPRNPSSINFVRNRMMYARAALDARGGVRFGLRHIHILNRSPLPESCRVNEPNSEGPRETDRGTVRVMMYMFPRQFGLHNVFTNDVDPWKTVQPFQDYTLRENEINEKYTDTHPKIPKRLRGRPAELVRKLQLLHGKCAYDMLLEHYCPMNGSGSRDEFLKTSQNTERSVELKTQVSTSEFPDSASASPASTLTPDTVSLRRLSMMYHATPAPMVSAFCRSVLSQIIPHEFWGNASVQHENEQVFLRNVDRFINLRRFESLSLHEVAQSIKISEVEWLATLQTLNNKLSQSDWLKRREIFNEFLYYLVDSLLVPLIRAHFHVTESSVHRYRLFYFRHDVWRSISEPALAELKTTMFEEVKVEVAARLLDKRSLGFSQIRLLPKVTGVRPIMNLRRRTVKNGPTRVLGPSINSVLAPAFNVLTFEKTKRPSSLGSTLFSVGDLYHKLKTFKSSLSETHKPLFFAKVDVTKAFDTIPQSAIVKVLQTLLQEDEYRISKHVQIKPGNSFRLEPGAKPMRRWVAKAHALDDYDTFQENLETEGAVGKKNVIFIENIVSQFKDRGDILRLLEEHIQRNLVKIGKRFYRQKEGIPQGSVVSSLLCNYFYADFEDKHLSILNPSESLLLRLIDDFLLITTNKNHAKRFLQVMHDGVPEYGIHVNPTKTLVNFEVIVNQKKITRVLGDNDANGFPYCGIFFDTKTLDISRDRERKKGSAVEDSLTVEFSKVPGKAFHRKVLNTFKIQAQPMFLDTSFNSLNTVLRNIYTAFLESATKTWSYVKCLPRGKQPGTNLMIKTISDLVELAFMLMKSKGAKENSSGYKCAVSKVQVEWLAVRAFRTELGRRQSRWKGVLEYLDGRIGHLGTMHGQSCLRMRGLVDGGRGKLSG